MLMTRKMALVNFSKCQPEKCDSGLCAAAQACPLKLIRQDVPYTVPMSDPLACRACGDCVRACPLKAVQLAQV